MIRTSAKQEEYGLGCLLTLLAALSTLLALDYIAEALAQTSGGRVVIAAAFFAAIIAFVVALVLTPCRRTS